MQESLACKPIHLYEKQFWKYLQRGNYVKTSSWRETERYGNDDG